MEKDEAIAVKFYAAAAESGYAQAQMDLALMYEQGRGVQKDLKQALQFYKAAADQGHSPALHRTGKMLEQGLGGQPEPQLALRYLRINLAVFRGSRQLNDSKVLHQRGNARHC